MEIFVRSLNFRNDQITWHRKHNAAWKDATEMIPPLSTPTIELLHQLSKENLEHHKGMVPFLAVLYAPLVVILLFFAEFAFNQPNFMNPVSGTERTPPEIVAYWLSLIGIVFAVYIGLLSIAQIAVQRAREVHSCIGVALILRRAEDNISDSSPAHGMD